MSNKGLLAIIAVVLIGILAVLVVHYHEEQKSPGDKIAEGIGDAFDQMGDDIKDSTK